MKSTKRILLLLICLTGLKVSAFAQTAKPNPNFPSADADFTITVRHKHRKDEIITTVSLERISIKSPDSQSEPLEFTSLFAYHDKSRFVPGAYIAFYSKAVNCRFPEKPDTIFIVDGETIRVSSDPKTALRGEAIALSLSDPEDGKCSDSLSVFLPRQIYLKIANAKTGIEVQTGKLKFRLEEAHLKALNEMARILLQ